MVVRGAAPGAVPAGRPSSMKNGSHRSSPRSSMPAPRHRHLGPVRSRPAARLDREPQPGRLLDPVVATHTENHRSRSAESSSRVRPRTGPSDLLVDHAEQLHVVLAERRDHVRRPPPRVPPAGAKRSPCSSQRRAAEASRSRTARTSGRSAPRSLRARPLQVGHERHRRPASAAGRSSRAPSRPRRSCSGSRRGCARAAAPRSTPTSSSVPPSMSISRCRVFLMQTPMITSRPPSCAIRAGLLVHDPLLEPQDLAPIATASRATSGVCSARRKTSTTSTLHVVGDVGERRVGPLPQHLGLVRVHRDDAVPVLLQVRGHLVRQGRSGFEEEPTTAITSRRRAGSGARALLAFTSASTAPPSQDLEERMQHQPGRAPDRVPRADRPSRARPSRPLGGAPSAPRASRAGRAGPARSP